jgi:hypothetical protein
MKVIPLRAVRLAGVLHQPQVVTLGQVGEPAHVGHLAVKVHRQDAPRARAHGRRDGVGIEVVVALAHIDHDRRRARLAHRLERCDEGLSGDDHLVALPNPGCNQRESQSIESARGANTFRCSAVGGEPTFEALDLRAVRELARGDEGREVGEHVARNRGVHMREVHEAE